MGNPLYGSNKADRVTGSSVVQGESPALQGASQKYITIPFDCYVKKIFYQTNVNITAGASVLVVKNEGDVMAGGGSMATGAVGTGGLAATLTTNTEFKAGDILEIENDATPDAGQVTYSVLCEATD